jgi:uncharacterized membrane protein
MPELVLPTKKRIDSIDILRGIIMIIMALDHVRDYFHIDAVTGNPTDMATTTAFLFFTRWITHYCAPNFVFLAGTAAFLTGQKKTKKELSVFLFKRGLFLILVDLIIFNLLLTFDPFYHTIGLAVIGVTGFSMVLLAVLVFLPLRTLFVIGLVLVAGHNYLDRFNAADIMHGNLLYGFLHQQHITPLTNGHMIFIFYPWLPWPGVMILGYCMGSWFAKTVDAEQRKKYLLRTGIITTLAFLIIRYINVYGDLAPWAMQKNATYTVLSFFNTTKYPPSLLYLCMTIGPGLIVLAFLENAKAAWTKIVVIYGRVPMFYYLLHFFLIHFLCAVIFFANGHSFAEADTGEMWFRPENFGYPLWAVYLIWISVVAFFYPLCKWYSKYKATHDYWWLSYL